MNRFFTICCLLCLLFSTDNGVAHGVTLDLDDCVRQVFANNPALSLSRIDTVEKELLLQSVRKNRYPALSFQYDYLRQHEPLPTLGLENYYSYGVTLTQPVYKGNSLVTGVQLGELNLELAGTTLSKTKNDVAYQVHEAYFKVLKAKKLSEVAAQAVEQLQSHRRDAAAFYEVGLIPKNDLLQSEVLLAQGEQDLLRAKNSLSLARAALNLLMRRNVDAELELVDILQHEPKQVDWTETVHQAMENRPELVQARIAVQQAEKGITIARAPYLPSVALSATYKRQGDSFDAYSYSLGDEETRYAMASLSWNFWTWRQGKNEVAAARQRERKSMQAQEQVIDAITLELKDAILNLELADENIKVTEKAIEQAEENFRINTARYQSQLATSTEVLDAQTLLTQTRSNYYNALYDYNLAGSKLEWALGVLAAE